MEIDRLSATIRRRSPWEGIDLGFAMARRWFLPLWSLWWATALPVTVVAVALLHDHPTLATFVVWWLKPLYEPLLLVWLSRRLFGEPLRFGASLRAWREVLPPRLLPNLLWRRFSPNRSFFMPVSHLEGLKGKARHKRLGVLSRNHSAGSWLTVVGAHIEAILNLSFLAVVLFLVPQELLPDDLWQLFMEEDPRINWLTNAFWLLAISLMAPFYVAGGFGLYLARRTALEAWDIELAFRRMQPRFKGVRRAAAAVVGALAIALAGVPAERAFAAADPAESLSAERARVLIEEVLAHEDFGQRKRVTRWEYVGGGEDEAKEPQGRPRDRQWVSWLAQTLEIALWLGGAALLVWAVTRLLQVVKWLPAPPGRPAGRGGAPTVLFGLAVTPESLPEDIAATVQGMVAAGQLRPAMGLLYRATLAHLIHDRHLRIPDSATEGECRRMVQRTCPAEEAAFFGRLTRTWAGTAYGHRLPQAQEVTVLCQRWQGLYGAPQGGQDG